jgi:hypothetical protein
MPKQNMRIDDIVLRCYAERERDGSWFAICLDLNLAVQASTAKDAKAKLHAQVEQYVREALTVDSEYVGDLLPRRAPIGFFFRYYMIRAICAMRGMNSHGHSPRRIFSEHLPVSLA